MVKDVKLVIKCVCCIFQSLEENICLIREIKYIFKVCPCNNVHLVYTDKRLQYVKWEIIWMGLDIVEKRRILGSQRQSNANYL